jgi:hypothetical protein
VRLTKDHIVHTLQDWAQARARARHAPIDEVGCRIGHRKFDNGPLEYSFFTMSQSYLLGQDDNAYFSMIDFVLTSLPEGAITPRQLLALLHIPEAARGRV